MKLKLHGLTMSVIYFCMDPWFILFIYLVFLLYLWAAPAAYGDSQARGRIGAAATGLRQSHSNTGPSHVCNLHHSSRQRRIFNPLNKAGTEPATSWFLVGFVSHCATTGTP